MRLAGSMDLTEHYSDAIGRQSETATYYEKFFRGIHVERGGEPAGNKQRAIYIIGSLRNPEIPSIGNKLRSIGWDAFDSWHDAGPEADDYWQKNEKYRGNDYRAALANHAAQNTFDFDKRNLDRCDRAVLALPAGKSGHLELGYVIGSGKPGYILLPEEPERFDVMYNFATKIFLSVEEMLEELK